MTSTAATPPVLGTEGTEDDVRAITAIVADVETAYNTNDPELMTAHFAADAAVVNAVGTRIAGRADLFEANRAGLAGFLRDEHVRYDVTDVVFLGPDIALANKEARATTPDGELIDTDPAMRALYVVVRRDGRWWVAARQNTLVTKPPAT